jgi:hypothetical protein
LLVDRDEWFKTKQSATYRLAAVLAVEDLLHRLQTFLSLLCTSPEERYERRISDDPLRNKTAEVMFIQELDREPTIWMRLRDEHHSMVSAGHTEDTTVYCWWWDD